jgi:dihydroxyacid dehydratase/phosphogluconate dehydratase
MFTANSMNCLLEALGWRCRITARPWRAPAEREALARTAGERHPDADEQNVTPRSIAIMDAFDDAYAL